MDDHALIADDDALSEIELLAAELADLPTATLAQNTRRYIEPDWDRFAAWCHRHKLTPLPVDPHTVGMYVLSMGKELRADGLPRYRAASIGRHVASISWMAFQTGGGRGLGKQPEVANAMRAVRLARQESRDAKRPLLLQDVKLLCAAMEHDVWPVGVTSARDTLVLLLGFAAALRRSSLTDLQMRDVTYVPLDGIHVRLRRSKTDQEGRGATVAVPFGQEAATCIPCAWIRWLRLVSADSRSDRMRLVYDTSANPSQWVHVCRGKLPTVAAESPLLRPVIKTGAIGDTKLSGVSINAIVKRRLAAAGYDPSAYGSHSLRAGMVTQARRNGASARAVRKVTGHASDEMVDVYDRDWNPMSGSAVLDLGL